MSTSSSVLFLTLIASDSDARSARLMIESLRAFGGELKDSPVWAYVLSDSVAGALTRLEHVEVSPIEIPDHIPDCTRDFPLSAKVFACAQAEAAAPGRVDSLVWMNPDCLIINPVLAFRLAPSFDFAARPVHHQNVGSLAGHPLDAYWQEIYRSVGLDEAPFAIESFADLRVLRPYFNTHSFAVRPAAGLMQSWRDVFAQLTANADFQAGPCRDLRHQIFLHQAALSALIVKRLPPGRIRILPPDYSYPLHMESRVPVPRRIPMQRLACAVYEDAEVFARAALEEPIKSWLRDARGHAD